VKEYSIQHHLFFLESTDPEKDLLQPAEKGTSNVLDSVNRSSTVKRVVLTASMASVGVNGGRLPPEHVYSEADWSIEEVMRERKIWYPLSKTLAEKKAWQMAEQQKKWSLVVINPTLVVGPLLQNTMNTSSEIILNYLNGKKQKIANSTIGLVDVRDVALAHILAFEKPEANGRYITILASLPWTEIVSELRKIAPHSSLPTEVESGDPPRPMLFNNSKVLSLLGSPLRSVPEMLKDTVDSLISKGLLKV